MAAPRRSAGALAVAALLALSPVVAAQSVRFEKQRHLEGYEEVYYSEWSDLYDLARFDELDGRTISSAELEQAVADWRAEVARVEAFLEELRADARRLFLFRLERDLEKHGFFSKISYERNDSFEPFVFYVQRPAKEDPAYEGRVVRELGEALTPLLEHFRRNYAEPLELARRPDHGAYAFVVLASGGEMQNYARLTTAWGHYRVDCAYDQKLEVGILIEDPFNPARTKETALRSARHALAHLLLQAHYSGGANYDHQGFPGEGLADYLAWMEDDVTGGLRRPDAGKEVLRLFVEALQEEDVGRTYYQPIEGLLQVGTYNNLLNRIVAAAPKGGNPIPPDYARIHRCYLRQSSLFVHYLEDPERRDAFLRFVGEELRGQGGPAAFQTAFALKEPATMDEAFLRHLHADHRRIYPDKTLRDAAIADILRPAPATTAETGAGATTATGAVATTATGAVATTANGAGAPAGARIPFEPARLLVADPDPETRLATALHDVRVGRTRDALATIDATLEMVAEDALRGRLERERTRIEEWIDLRDRWLADLAATGGSLRFQHDGRNVKAEVREVAEGVVRLEKNRAQVEELAVEALDAYELARQMGRRGDELAGQRVRLYPYVLAQDGKWSRLLKEDDDASSALGADAREDYPARLLLAAACAGLEELAALEPPRGPAEAQALIERIEGFVGTYGDLALIEAKRAELRAFAGLAFGEVFDSEAPRSLLNGGFEALGDGRVRLTYDFDDAAELNDFVEFEYLESVRKAFGPVRAKERVGFQHERGAIVAIGEACARHVLGFRSPMTVTCRYSYVRRESDDDLWRFSLGACGDLAGLSFVRTFDLDGLAVGDGGSYENKMSTPRVGVLPKRNYEIGLRNDGETVTTFLDGDDMHSLPVGTATSGNVFLFVHSDRPIRVDRLVIEGTIDPAGLERSRAEWIRAKVADL